MFQVSRHVLLVGLCTLLSFAAVSSASAAESGEGNDKAPPAARRAALFEAAERGEAGIPALREGLEDENPIIRRTALGLLIRQREPAAHVVADAMGHSDPDLRLTALRALIRWKADGSTEILEKALRDDAAEVRKAAVQELAAIEPRTQKVEALLQKATDDPDESVKQLADQALWPFRRHNVTVRESGLLDREMTVAESFELPEKGWKLKFDPEAQGHRGEKPWFAPDFDDSKWRDIAIADHWDNQGVKYHGVAWYRGTFQMPRKPETKEHSTLGVEVAVDLMFGAVDEEAWVWVNGDYIGAHDAGAMGWDKPFALDITKEVEWGTKNQITVRVHNDRAAGGIWRPVKIEVVQ